MPHYYFHVTDGERLEDQDGRDLPNLGAALRHAQEVARTIMADEITWTGRVPADECIQVADQDGLLVTVPFKDMVTIPIRAVPYGTKL